MTCEHTEAVRDPLIEAAAYVAMNDIAESARTLKPVNWSPLTLMATRSVVSYGYTWPEVVGFAQTQEPHPKISETHVLAHVWVSLKSEVDDWELRGFDHGPPYGNGWLHSQEERA